MTNQQILIKAIKKAIYNGWRGNRYVRVDALDDKNHDFVIHQHAAPEATIFDHDFAKVLWGDENVYTIGDGKPLSKGPHALLHPLIPRWQYHLQHMVIADDPIKYLGDHIE